MLYKRIVLLFIAMIFVLAGCQTPPLYSQTEGNVADVAQRAKDAIAKSDAAAKPLPALVVNQGLYVDKTPISLAKDPAWSRNKIVIKGDKLPFSYYSRTIVGGNSNNSILNHYQVGLDQNVQVSMDYTGTVKGAMDLLAAKTGYVYTINDNTVYWQSTITKVFDIAFMPGTADYTLGDSANSNGGGSGGGGGASGGGDTGGLTGLASKSSLSGKVDLWADLENTVKELLSPEGRVIVSRATTSVTVKDKPTNIDLIAKYITNLNKNLSKQVLVKIQVFEVGLTSDFNYGIDWQIVKRSFMGTNFVLNGNYGTPVSITPAVTSPSNLPFGGTVLPGSSGLPQAGFMANDQNHGTGINVLITALQQQGKVSVVSEPRVVCLNNQVSVISLVDKRGYAQSVSSTALAGGTSGGGSGGSGAGGNSVTSSITPGTLTTGLILYVLPKILDNKIYLQVNADLSNFIKIDTFTSGGSGGSSASIQTPHITEKQFNQRSVIASGDTLILSGFRKVANQSSAMQLYDSQALGGKGSIQDNSETVVLITPIILDGTV
jgi:type IVB pilus formation R64 PilN family outer membrane protein